MGTRRLILIMALLISIIVGLSLNGQGVTAQAQHIVADNPAGTTVQPLTTQEQEAIDKGQTSPTQARVRPDTYTYTADMQNCVTQVSPIKKGQAGSSYIEQGCYGTFAEALSVATNGRVQVSSDFRPDDLTQDILDKDLPGTSTQADGGNTSASPLSVVIGVEYWDANFAGSSWIVDTAYAAGCTDGTTFGFPTFPSGHTTWDNNISSARGYTGCIGIHYENINYVGPTQAVCGQNWTDCANMGSMNDKTSSINWHR